MQESGVSKSVERKVPPKSTANSCSPTPIKGPVTSWSRILVHQLTAVYTNSFPIMGNWFSACRKWQLLISSSSVQWREGGRGWWERASCGALQMQPTASRLGNPRKAHNPQSGLCLDREPVPRQSPPAREREHLRKKACSFCPG